jgi:hypothetical protein
MPFRFEFDAEHRILLVIAVGEFGDADQIAIVDSIRERAAALNAAAGIGDYTELESYTASAAAIQVAARQPSPYPPNAPRFLVAPRDHVFGASRMYKAIADRTSERLRVVRSRQEALDLLGVLNPDFEPVPSS